MLPCLFLSIVPLRFAPHALAYLLPLLLLFSSPPCLIYASSQEVFQNLSLLGSNDYVRSFVSRRDGKIIVAAVSTEGASGDSVLLSYTPDGKVDHKFGADGKVRVGFVVDALLLLSDGDKLIAVGQQRSVTPSTNQPALRIARYNTDGSLDTTFGADGVVAATLPLESEAVIRAVAIDNKIIITGQLSSPRGGVFLLRYLPDGQIDSGFGVNGKVTEAFETAAVLLALHAQPDGELMLAGATPTAVNNTPAGEPVVPFGPCSWSRAYTDHLLFFVRFQPDGKKDSGFGKNGTALVNFSPFQRIAATAFQNDGKLLITGNDINCHFTLARYLPDGSRDTTFGFQGTVRSVRQSVAGVPPVVQHDGKILVTTASFETLFLTSYTASGGENRSFGKNGEIISTIHAPNSLTVLPTGSVMIVGSVYRTNSDLALQRYMPDGSPDIHFGNAGLVTTNLTLITDVDRCDTEVPSRSRMYNRTKGAPTAIRDEAAAVIIQPDGKIIVAGTAGAAVVVIRYLPKGNLDNTFGTGGIVTTRLGVEKTEELGPHRDVVTTLELLSDWQIVVRGRMWDGVGWSFFVVRYRPDGSRDSSIGDNGSTPAAVSRNYRNHIEPEQFYGNDFHSQSKITQPDGKVVRGGASSSGLDQLFVLARYDAPDQYDISFGTAGKVMEKASNFASPSERRGLAFSPFYNCEGFCQIAVQPDGKILAAGNPFYRSIALFRVHPDGSVDKDFGIGGKVITEVGANSDIVAALALQPDGKILVAATCANARHTNFALVRYLPDGRLDPTFDNDGKTTLRVSEEIPDPHLLPATFVGAAPL